MKLFKSKIDKIIDQLVDIGIALNENKGELIDYSDKFTSLVNNITDKKEKYLFEGISTQIQLCFMVVGYDSEMLCMLSHIRDDRKKVCLEASLTYSKNAEKI